VDREPSEAEDFYTVDKAARILKLTPGRIRQMLRAGELEGVTSTRYFDSSTAPRRTAGDNLARLRAFRYAVRMPDASRPVGDLRDDQIRKRLRVPVEEVAHLLGISPEAVRSRLYRGTLNKETGTGPFTCDCTTIKCDQTTSKRSIHRNRTPSSSRS
jgi:hypothetical protein